MGMPLTGRRIDTTPGSNKDDSFENGGSTPSQYALPKDAVELQDLIEHREMDFSVGNIFKACYRLGEKEGVDELYDINKIIFFAERKKQQILKKKNQCNQKQ